ncbi:uncharacterized protein LOC143023793 [Oratosquilla oratoria]|uniref:uncharacterized protein LOC143023793 n=1 Tax=Oratosquilla oratoria TaxID=337810 RepID=UPI003F762D9A
MPNDLQLWCEDCQQGYDGDCEEHGPLTPVADTSVSTRARRSTPHVLELRETLHWTGVFAKERLAKRLQFGPLQAQPVTPAEHEDALEEEITDKYGIVFKLFGSDGQQTLLDTRQEERSNWMIFVRPAEKKLEQNLVAFQYKGDVYFATIKEVPERCELKVWFSRDYAERMGTRVLAEEGVSWQFRTRQRFKCKGCEVVFSSAASLANHRCARPQVVLNKEEEASESSTGESSISRRGGKKRVLGRRGRGSTSSVLKGPEVKRSIPKVETSPKKIVKQKSPSRPVQEVASGSAVKLEVASPASSIESSSVSSASETPERKTSKGGSPKGKNSVYKCDVCEKVFHSPGKLKQHTYAHTGERPFQCQHCDKAFSSRFKLVRHELIHTSDRQHKCPLCDRSFHRKDHLKNHIQIHDPTKQFKCEKAGCGKEYSSYMSYRKHCAVHAAEEGDLQCRICQKMFDTKSDLIYHLKVHVGSRSVKSPSEKKFQCDFCERRFFTRKDVKRHLVVHTGKRDFGCSLCSQKFGRKDHLVRHIKKSHGVGEISKVEKSEPSNIPGPSSGPQALSPEPPLVSPSHSASTPEQSLTMVLLQEPLPGPSGLQGPSGIPSPHTEPPFISGLHHEMRLFEAIKEEPELSASVEGIGSDGDDLGELLGMYLPSGSINLTSSSLLDPSGPRPLESEMPRSLLESALMHPSEVSRGERVVGDLAEPLSASHVILPNTQSSEFSQASLLASTEGSRISPVAGSLQPSASPTTGNSCIETATTTASVPVTTSSPFYSTLPGFEQAFP